MTIDRGSLGSFGDLAVALGLLDPSSGEPNAAWFDNPVVGGSGPTAHGLSSILADDDQRAALLTFVEKVLGDPDGSTREGATWVPLLVNLDPALALYAVVEQVDTEVRVGIGLDHTSAGDPPTVSTTVHVPLFRFARRGSTLTGGGTGPDWMLLGRPGGDITIALDVTLNATTPVPGHPSLGGTALSLMVPTDGSEVGFELTLRDLMLPGATQAETFTLDVDQADQLGASVLNLLSGLIRAEADALGSSIESEFKAFAALAGLFGLRDLGDLPPLPIADLPTRGVRALVEWVEDIIKNPAWLDIWLTQLADLVGGDLDAARDAVVIPVGTETGVGAVAVTAGVRVTPGTGGQPVLVPWVEASLIPRGGVVARAAVDLLMVDTGTGTVEAIPAARLEAVFGGTGASALVDDTPTFGVDSLTVGVSLDAQHRPAFVLTADGVVLNGAPARSVDLSSPAAVLQAGEDAVTSLLTDALDSLGDAGDLVAQLLGVTATGGVPAISVPALFGDPIGTIRAHWQAVLADTHGAMSDLLGRLSALVRGEAAALAPGTGESADPWVVALLDADGVDVRLEAWRGVGAQSSVLQIDAAGVLKRTVLDDCTLTSRVAVGVATLDFAGPHATFATGAMLSAALTRADETPARLELGPIALTGTEIALEASWAPVGGLGIRLRSDDLALETAGRDSIHLPLPMIGPDGALTLPSPDWAEIEAALAALIGELGIPELQAGLALTGWSGVGPRLALGDLLSGNATALKAAIETWLADLLLDCDVVRTALGPVAALMSGFTLSAPSGLGTTSDPYRCPIAGVDQAPALRAWLDPGCDAAPDPRLTDSGVLLGSNPPLPETVVSALRRAGGALPDLADLLVGRDSVGDGLTQLLARFQDTDGLIGLPATMPSDVNGVSFPGRSYGELVAAGRNGVLAGRVVLAAGDVVHVGTEAEILLGRADGTTVDLSGDGAIAALAAGVGPWFVRLPTPSAAAAARPDRGAVGEQSARLEALLSGRAGEVVLIGYGAAGAAALHAAATLESITDVVTVGTPWSELSTLALDSGLSGDALQLLRRLQRPEMPLWPDQLLGIQCTPLQRMRLLVQRAIDPTARDLPRADTEVRRAGLKVHAVFGALDQTGLARALAAYAADSISARSPQLAAADDIEPEHALHLAVDLPVFDLDLGGLLVGVGAVFEACQVTRVDDGMTVQLARSLTVDVHLGVHGGWLVGGPGSGSDSGDVRWVEAKVVIPLDGSAGSSQLILHEAQALGVDKEAWVVQAGLDSVTDTVTATGALPPVRVLVGDVVGRLQAASPSLATLLSRLALLDGSGLNGTGGLDLDGFDRFLHDPAATMSGLVAAAHADIAAAVRTLVPSSTGTGSVIGWTIGTATIGIDLSTGSLTAGVTTTGDEGILPVTIDVTASPSAAGATITIGQIDPHLGGGRLVLATPLAGSPAFVRAEWASAGGATQIVPLWPTPDTDGLIKLITLTLPGIAIEGAIDALRVTLTGAPLDALEAGLSASGLLQEREYGGGQVSLPLAFISDPAAFVMAVGRQAGADLAALGAQLLDALGHLITTTPTPGTWPLTEGAELRYAKVGDTLTLGLHVELDETLNGHEILSSLQAGLALRPGLPPAPAVDVSVQVGDHGLAIHLDPGPRIELLQPPNAPLPIYPNGPGLGQALESLLPDFLNRAAGLATDPPGLAKDVGTLVTAAGDALDLRTAGTFTSDRITAFANDPAAALISHLTTLVGTTTAALVDALNGGSTGIAITQTPGIATLTIGTAPDTVSLTLDATGASPAVVLGASWDIPDVGVVHLDALRLSATGVAVTATLGPICVQAGPITLRPLLTVSAGTAATTRLLGIGLALDDAGVQSVELRWGLDATPPTLVAVDRGETPLVTEAGASMRLLSLGVGLASGVILETLPDGFLDARTIRVLGGVVFAEGATPPAIDPVLIAELLDPDKLLTRVQRLLWNAAIDPDPFTVTIEDTVIVSLAKVVSDPFTRVGVSVKLPGGQRYKLSDEDTVVELEVNGLWVTDSDRGNDGLTILAMSGIKASDEPGSTLDPNSDAGKQLDFAFEPGVIVQGLGLRFTKQSGPLLSLGPIALDGFAVRAYAECDASGVGGGAQVAMLGLAVAPGGAGGENPVANGIMSDAGKASPAQRPAFDPALAIQQHPGQGLDFSIRAGDPPGPWWVVVQRQLGPLYIERVGFDEQETAGKPTRIALLFDGGVTIFGLTAQVDQLSITWTGGDLLDIHHWAVDLMGLAISADLSGATLAGGLLKTVDQDNNPAYVGMLVGKFGIYGLTVFGGYTSLGGAASFFVFGALNGPIGGPPAFFVTGIAAGLGINRKLVSPTDPAKMDDFPFIQALDPYAEIPDPMAELKALAAAFPPELDNFWFAAGISFTCFGLVDGIAVVAVSFGQGLEIDLMGLARMALPRPEAALVSIEMGLIVKFSTSEGIFLMQAGLTDNSWLLYEDVRLTGGFAFATWWKGPLHGQLVFTIGGYHPDFHVDGYPDVQRLGLSWQVTDDISIKGGAYFAITSEAAMAGVGVQAVADFGWAWARATFSADGLVYYVPFWYDVSVQATISAGVKIDTWLGTISFSITTGCGVHVWGPDFSGEATVEVGPCSVTIPFGSNAAHEGAILDWADFVAAFLEDAGEGLARALSAITGRGSLPTSTGGNTSAPPPDGTVDHPFEVYAEFDLSLVSTVPTTIFELGATAVSSPAIRSDGAGASLGLSPMKLSVSDVTLAVALEWFNAPDQPGWSAHPELMAGLAGVVGTSSFPIGIWGAPGDVGSKSVPTRVPSGDVINAGALVTLTSAATGTPVGPEISSLRVDSGARRPLPFTATKAQRESLQTLAATVIVPTAGDVDAAVTAAHDILFATFRAPDASSPLLATGVRSQVAAAGFRGGLAAPPLFGNLTDGLAISNPDTALSGPLPPVPPQQAPATMDPRVVGFFAAGAAVALRDPVTTVAGRAATGPGKRRPAPTTESVHARLSTHLPLSLQVGAVPAATIEQTVTPSALPFSGVASAARSYRLGDFASLSRVAGIGGLGGTAIPATKAKAATTFAKDASTGSALSSGDVVVLHAPDHATDTSAQRPTLDLGGTGRVTCVRGDGRVLVDEVASGVLEVPSGTALLAVQADAVLTGLDGCAGWHTRSKVAALGPSAALVAGAVVIVERGTTPIDPGWMTAGDLVRGAARVITRFSTPVITVALVVETDLPDRVGDMGLRLEGATRALAPDGTMIDPHLVMNGGQAVAVYDIVVNPDSTAVQVSVAPAGTWRLTGVLGSGLTAEAMATLVMRRGLVAATARLTAVTGAGCSPIWGAAPSASAPKAVRRSAAKKAAPKTRKKGAGRGR